MQNKFVGIWQGFNLIRWWCQQITLPRCHWMCAGYFNFFYIKAAGLDTLYWPAIAKIIWYPTYSIFNFMGIANSHFRIQLKNSWTNLSTWDSLAIGNLKLVFSTQLFWFLAQRKARGRLLKTLQRHAHNATFKSSNLRCLISFYKQMKRRAESIEMVFEGKKCAFPLREKILCENTDSKNLGIKDTWFENFLFWKL